MSPEALALIIGGLTAFAGAVFAGLKTMREGTGARQRDLMRDIERRADRAEHNLRQEEIRRRYYERRCVRAEAGHQLPPLDPPEWVEWVDPEDKRR